MGSIPIWDGQVFGLYGAMGELANANKTKQVCKDLTIRITLKNINSNQILIPIIDFEHNTNSNKFKEKFDNAKNIAAALDNIIASQNNTTNNISTDKYAELKELNNLLKDGILTQEEFEEQKARILKQLN